MQWKIWVHLNFVLVHLKKRVRQTSATNAKIESRALLRVMQWVKSTIYLGTNLGRSEVPLPMFGVMLDLKPTVERERNKRAEPTVLHNELQLKQQQPVVPVEAQWPSGRSARQQPDFNLSTSYLSFHSVRNTVGSACSLWSRMPPQAYQSFCVSHATKRMHPFRVIDDDTNDMF